MSVVDDNVTIEVNGVPMQARRGQMLIEVTDAADIYVPRFCYHRKLSIAANCRMCLVQVDKAPKPLPACATPVSEGMKVFTRSQYALDAQKATMEFLLINHPLDCPICDQGGECELQDLAMGFGRGVSRYTERKRVVKDKNLGPLVSTDMTRCIHCTRCVRFGQEVAGIQELGTIGRGENMQISTYIERSVDHELSGNIIDLCPVGALNNKPFRFRARAWEMAARPLIAPHDCAGSNMDGHVLRGKLMRVVPRDNDAINETWISDRDRYSCYGIYTTDRLTRPMLKVDQEWTEVGWNEALSAARDALHHAVEDGGDGLGVLVSPSATVEEMVLLERITRHLGSNNIDHRLRRRDVRDQQNDPRWPALGCTIEELETRDGLLLIGSNIRAEVPILAHRIRKAALRGAAVGFVNPVAWDQLYPVAAHVTADVSELVSALASVLLAAAEITGSDVDAEVAEALEGVPITDEARAAAGVLLGRRHALVLIGHIAQRHPRYTELRALAAALASATGAGLGYLTEGANSAGAALAGILPHRAAGGGHLDNPGLDALAMLSAPRHAYLLFGMEPDHDVADASLAEQALQSADSVICMSAYVTDALLDCADILLPISTFAESGGTYVNAEGRWQSFAPAADLVGESRPGWRVLRVLGNQLDLPECEYFSADEIRDELKASLGDVQADNSYDAAPDLSLEPADVALDELDIGIHAVDPLVRRSEPLQRTQASRSDEAADGVEQAAG